MVLDNIELMFNIINLCKGDRIFDLLLSLSLLEKSRRKVVLYANNIAIPDINFSKPLTGLTEVITCRQDFPDVIVLRPK